MRAGRNTGRWLARNGRKADIPRFETNKLVTTGYYEGMRHPMHFGLLLFPMSFALILGSLSSIFIVAPLEILFIIAMIKLVEEPGAIRKFRDQYRNYQKQVPIFAVRLSCLKQLFGKS
jgi:protein-S-isoprenylcysteine O-methyltransferase Ste14